MNVSRHEKFPKTTPTAVDVLRLIQFLSSVFTENNKIFETEAVPLVLKG